MGLWVTTKERINQLLYIFGRGWHLTFHKKISYWCERLIDCKVWVRIAINSADNATLDDYLDVSKQCHIYKLEFGFRDRNFEMADIKFSLAFCSPFFPTWSHGLWSFFILHNHYLQLSSIVTHFPYHLLKKTTHAWLDKWNWTVF